MEKFQEGCISPLQIPSSRNHTDLGTRAPIAKRMHTGCFLAAKVYDMIKCSESGLISPRLLDIAEEESERCNLAKVLLLNSTQFAKD